MLQLYQLVANNCQFDFYIFKTLYAFFVYSYYICICVINICLLLQKRNEESTVKDQNICAEKSVIIPSDNIEEIKAPALKKQKLATHQKTVNKEETYRNNLKPFVEFMHKVKEQRLLRKSHIRQIASLPLAMFIRMIYDGVISVQETTKTSASIDIIVKNYRKHFKQFQFEDLRLTLTEDDIAELLGVSKEGEIVKVSGHIKKNEKTDTEYSSFMERHFKGEANVSKKRIEEQFFYVVKQKSEQDKEDSAKLILLHLTATFLLSNSNSSVSSNLVPYCVCNEKISKISWPRTVHKHLMDQIEKYNESPRKITACVTILLVLYMTSNFVNCLTVINFLYFFFFAVVVL